MIHCKKKYQIFAVCENLALTASYFFLHVSDHVSHHLLPPPQKDIKSSPLCHIFQSNSTLSICWFVNSFTPPKRLNRLRWKFKDLFCMIPSYYIFHTNYPKPLNWIQVSVLNWLSSPLLPGFVPYDT